MECCYPWKQCIEVHVTKDDSTIEKKFHRQIVSFWGNQQDRDCKTKLCLLIVSFHPYTRRTGKIAQVVLGHDFKRQN